jgi:hypothetical protein
MFLGFWATFLENPQIMVDLGNMDEAALNRLIIQYN